MHSWTATAPGTPSRPAETAAPAASVRPASIAVRVSSYGPARYPTRHPPTSLQGHNATLDVAPYGWVRS